MIKRSATAIWEGNIKEGKGTTTSQSKLLNNAPFSFVTRFENNNKETNPEELIATALADCFSMMLTNLLSIENFTAKYIETLAEVTLNTKQGAITNCHLIVKAEVPSITKDHFEEIIQKAKTDCPVSKLLRADISLSYSLV